MTDVLRETLEERGRATPWEDVDALVAAGDRRVRRRRVAAGAAAVAAVAVLAVVTPLAVGGLGQDRVQVAADAYDPAAPSWAVDGTVHVGDAEVELGEQPKAYVLTDAGVVWIDATYDVRLTDPSGATERIGSSTDPAAVALVTDGRYVAWLDRDAEEFVGFDTAAGEVAGTVSYEEAPRSSDAELSQLVALDGGLLWTYDQVHRLNTARDLTEPVLGRSLSVRRHSRDRAFLDVAGGRYVREAPSEARVRVHRIEPDDPGLPVPGRRGALLSPDATYVVTQPGRDFTVLEVSTGARMLRPSAEDSLAPVRWLDGTTLEAVVSGPEVDDPVSIVTCTVPRGTCETVAEDVAPSYSELTMADGIFPFD